MFFIRTWFKPNWFVLPWVTCYNFEGSLPPRAVSLVIEWAALHQHELMENWQLAREEQKPRKIEPLR